MPSLASDSTYSFAFQPLQSVLKKSSAARGHRRVFSHGQIPVQNMEEEGSSGGGGGGGGGVSKRGHRRTVSKTDFILPPGHEERERKRSSVTRSGSHRSTSAGGAGLGSAGVASELPSGSAHARKGSGFHRR